MTTTTSGEAYDDNHGQDKQYFIIIIHIQGRKENKPTYLNVFWQKGDEEEQQPSNFNIITFKHTNFDFTCMDKKLHKFWYDRII